MDSFTPLEQSALNAIIAELTEGRNTVECQLRHAKVLSRENTAGGFFVDIEVNADIAQLKPETAPLGQNVWIGVAGLEYGLGAILHCKAGRVSLLEGYAVGAEDTSSIDFSKVQFAIIKDPGSLISTDS